MTFSLHITGVVRVVELFFGTDVPLVRADLDWAVQRGHARVALETPNHITNEGLKALVGVYAGGWGNPSVGGEAMGPTVDLRLFTPTQMKLTDAVSPTAPALTDAALEDAVIWTGDVISGAGDSLLTVTYPATGRVQFSTVVPKTSLNGTTITEEGLFNANGTLLHRCTFSKLKVDTVGLQFDHLLQIALA